MSSSGVTGKSRSDTRNVDDVEGVDKKSSLIWMWMNSLFPLRNARPSSMTSEHLHPILDNAQDSATSAATHNTHETGRDCRARGLLARTMAKRMVIEVEKATTLPIRPVDENWRHPKGNKTTPHALLFALRLPLTAVQGKLLSRENSGTTSAHHTRSMFGRRIEEPRAPR